jgi:hypothetical protein
LRDTSLCESIISFGLTKGPAASEGAREVLERCKQDATRRKCSTQPASSVEVQLKVVGATGPKGGVGGGRHSDGGRKQSMEEPLPTRYSHRSYIS